MGLYRKVPASPEELSRLVERLVDQNDRLHRRITRLEDNRGVRTTGWTYVGTYPNDAYLTGTPWQKYLTPISPPWENGAYPLDPTNSPVRFRLLIDREITPEIEGGFQADPNVTMFTLPTGYFRTDVPYVRYVVSSGPATTITIQINDDGTVVPLA